MIEDEPGLRALLERVLAGAGYQVSSAREAEEAFEVWERMGGVFTVALIDLKLPGQVGGREIAARLRSENPTLQIILTSGEMPVLDHTFDWLEPFAFLLKPFSLSQLLNAVRAAFANHPESKTSN